MPLFNFHTCSFKLMVSNLKSHLVMCLRRRPSARGSGTRCALSQHGGRPSWLPAWISLGSVGSHCAASEGSIAQMVHFGPCGCRGASAASRCYGTSLRRAAQPTTWPVCLLPFVRSEPFATLKDCPIVVACLPGFSLLLALPSPDIPVCCRHANSAAGTH